MSETPAGSGSGSADAAEAANAAGSGITDDDPDDADRPAGVDRFRAGALGSGVGGLLLIGAGLLLPYAAAAAVVLVAGALAVLFRRGAPGFGVGMGAIGLVAAVEATPGLGLGLDAVTLGALAVAFAVVDAAAARVLGRFGAGR
ncbi:hypothetical protein JCM17823_17460 [Halorubrum gandharaense]